MTTFKYGGCADCSDKDSEIETMQKSAARWAERAEKAEAKLTETGPHGDVYEKKLIWDGDEPVTQADYDQLRAELANAATGADLREIRELKAEVERLTRAAEEAERRCQQDPCVVESHVALEQQARSSVGDLQKRIVAWVRKTFGDAMQENRHERVARLVEEALELGQAEHLDVNVVRRIIDRVYNRPEGQPGQEASGVLLTFLAWCEAAGVDYRAEGVRELDRVEALDPEYLRARHNAKAAAGTVVVATVERGA